MKTNKLILIGILIVAFAAMVAPVSAGTSGSAAISGNPTAYISIDLNQTAIPLTLTPGSTAHSTILGVTVSSNGPFTVTVADSTSRGTKQGYMGNYTTSYVAAPLDTAMESPISLAGTTNGTTIAQTITPPIVAAPAKQLFAGTGPATSRVLATDFSQPVSYTDILLPSGSTYRLDLTFTIAAA